MSGGDPIDIRAAIDRITDDLVKRTVDDFGPYHITDDDAHDLDDGCTYDDRCCAVDHDCHDYIFPCPHDHGHSIRVRGDVRHPG